MKTKFNVYRHHDIRELLKEYIETLKQHDSSYSLRKFSKACELSPGYLPLVFARKRKLSSKSLNKILTHLSFNKEESEFLGLLLKLSESDSQQEREKAFKKIYKIRNYRNENPEDLNAHKYLDDWLNVAIRELAQLKDFDPDPFWIKKKLKFKVNIEDIRNSLNFLINNNFLKYSPNGKIQVPEQTLECHGGVFKLSMSSFHKQIADLASESIFETPQDERNLVTQTIAIDPEDFDRIKDIMNEAVDKILTLSKKGKNRDSLYQISQYAFPLTHKKSEASS